MSEERRELIKGLGIASLALLAPRALATPSAPRNENVLVCVFLRGGCDALNMIVPYGDEVYGQQYYDLRPRLAIPGPNDQSADAASRARDIGGGFGLHPDMRPLHDILVGNDNADQDIAFIHAVGPKARSRSHFDAQAITERAWDGVDGPRTGWLGRYLQHMHDRDDPDCESANLTPFRAVALGRRMPKSLYGAGSALSMNNVDSFELYVPAWFPEETARGVLRDLYAGEAAIDGASIDLLDGFDIMDNARDIIQEPPEGLYSNGGFSLDLKEAAKIIKTGAALGTEAITIDIHGWDTHALQAHDLSNLLTSLSEGLKSFYTDLKNAGMKDKVTVLVMSEFGRRAGENGSKGTDHGSGGCMIVMGGGVKGGLYYDRWLPLDKDSPEAQAPDVVDIAGASHRGDLMATIDYRDVLREVIQNAAPNANLDRIFNNPEDGGISDYQPKTLGLFGGEGLRKVEPPEPKVDPDEGGLGDIGDVGDIGGGLL